MRLKVDLNEFTSIDRYTDSLPKGEIQLVPLCVEYIEMKRAKPIDLDNGRARL